MSNRLIDAFYIAEIFQLISPASVAALTPCASLKRLKKGETIFLDREIVTTAYIVISGFVSLYKVDSSGDKKVIFILGTGKFVNEIALQDLPSSVNCEVFEDVELLCFSRNDLLRVMENDFSLCRSIMDSHSCKTRRLYRQLKNTTGSIASEKKIAAKLWKLSRDFGQLTDKGVIINLKMSITYLADMLGLKRETVSRHLKDLTEQGLVIIEDKKFIIPDRDKLSEFFKKL